MDFFTPKAGQQRRAWLDGIDRRIDEGMRYFLGPSGADRRIGAGANALAMLSDGTDFVDAYGASGDMMRQPSFGNALAMVPPVVAMAMPGISNRLLQGAGDVAGDAARFMSSEDGGLRLFHGSPHDFDKFSMDKIGTGEGAQAYGHGLYFAEAEDVARSYRDQLSRVDPALVQGRLQDRLANMAQEWGVTVDDIPDIVDMAEERAAVMRQLEAEFAQAGKGRMYEVDVNANPEDFLDWDAPMSAQPQKVRDALGPRVDALRQAGAGLPQDPIGEALWRVAHPQGGFDKTDFSRSVPEQATERLRSAGIPGIRYLDQGSRGAGDGSRNYVVFDENLINIVRKYGVAGAATALGVSAREVEAAMQQGQKPRDNWTDTADYLRSLGVME